MKRLYFIFILACFYSLAHSQGELDDQEKIFYRNEHTFAILLNSNGIGSNFRYGKRIDGFRKTLYEIELNYLKHPKEIKATIQTTNKNIIYGKTNSVFTLKGAIGFQKELFQKKDLGSISIRYFTNLGPSLAFKKPVYYEYYNQEKKELYFSKFEPHNYPKLNGRAPFSHGLNEISVVPGIYGKFGFTFEYSKIDEIFHALELGVGFEAYIAPLNIMATPPQKVLFILPDDQFVLTLFLAYRFGRIIDTQFNPKRSKIDNIIVD